MTRHLLISLFISLILGQISAAQSNEKKIAQIKQTFSDINNTHGLKTVTLDAEEFLDQTPDGGGSLTGYFNKDSLVKIKEWIGLSYGVLEADYYFNKSALIFLYVREEHFQLTDSGVDHNKLTTAFEGRYYFDQDKIFAEKKKGTGFWNGDANNIQSIREEAEQYSKLLYERRNKVK